MGIKNLLSFLRDTYPLIFHPFSCITKPTIHCLFIDFNSILYYANKATKGMGFDYFMKEVFRCLMLIVDTVSPRSLIYVSIDGTPPYAKSVIHRRRRLSAKERSAEETENNLEFVPGFISMETIHLQLYTFLEEHRSKWPECAIVYDSYHTPGEAEHKIFEFILEHSYLQSYPICIYSNDSDMVLLALKLHSPDIIILKDIPTEENNIDTLPMSSPLSFEQISIGILTDIIMNDYQTSDNAIIDDFVAMFLLFSSDYFEGFPDFSGESSFFVHLIYNYREHIFKKMHLVENNVFSSKSLIILLKEVLKMPSHLPIYQNFRYEQTLSEKDKKTMTVAALDNLQWICLYYNGRCPSWDYYYDYDFVLPLSVFAHNLSEFNVKFPIQDKPLTPFESALVTCNLRSISLAPQPIGDLFIELFDKAELKEYSTYYKGPQFYREQIARISDKLTIDMININQISPPFCLLISKSKFSEFSNQHFLIDPFVGIPLPRLRMTNMSFKVVTSFSEDQNKLITFISLNNKFPTDDNIDIKQLKNQVVLVHWPYFTPVMLLNVIPRKHLKDFSIVNKMNENLGLRKCQNNHQEFLFEGYSLEKSSLFSPIYSWSTRKQYYFLSTVLPLSTIPFHRNIINNSVLTDNSTVVIVNGEYRGLIGTAIKISERDCEILIHDIHIKPYRFDTKLSLQELLLSIETHLIKNTEKRFESNTIVERIKNITWNGFVNYNSAPDLQEGSIVILVANNTGYPYGEVGTIVKRNMKNQTYYVIMNNEFPAGIDFGGLLTTKRGIIVGFSDVVLYKD